MVAHRSSVSRFAAKAIEPERVVPLPASHPALSEGRTIFMKTVSPSRESPRFLISGHSNTKLGKAVTKGPLAGYAIYQLSLEERATCPRSCQQWASCYGNSMPFARRHTPDADFERLLSAEVATLCRTHPDGLLVRLHVLGDFYSVGYVYLWAALIAEFPQLTVFGYTSRRTDDADPETVRIARAIKVLTDGAWNRFAIRTSGDGNPERSQAVVVDEDPDEPGTIVCPAQTKATEACASCGLCWAPGARDKTIAFLRHGRKLRGPKVANDLAPVAPAPIQSVAPVHPVSAGRERPLTGGCAKALAFLNSQADVDGKVSVTWSQICHGSGVPSGSMGYTMETLEKRRVITIVGSKAGKRGDPVTYQIARNHRVAGTRPPVPAQIVPAPSPIKLTTKVAPRPVTRQAAAPSADDLPERAANDVRPRSLNARKPGQCAYPTNSPDVGRGEETTYCCDPVAGRLSYCAAHMAVMFGKRTAA